MGTRKKVQAGEYHLLGWCSDGYHEECMVETVSGIKCECPCPDHGTVAYSGPSHSEGLQRVMDKYYHPNGKLKKPSEIVQDEETVV